MPYLKMLWQTESPTPQVGSWDFWTSTSGFISDLGITKTNNGIAYYAAIHTTGGDRALLISPMANAVEYNGYTQHGYIVDANNITWWINAIGTISNYDSACLLSDTVYGDMADAARDLVNKIYAVPFHEDYQTGQTYTLTATNLRRTIRKAIGTYLHRHTVRYREGYAYKLLSDDADNIIDIIITEITNKGSQEGLIYIIIPSGALSFDIAVVHGTQGSIGQNTNQVPNATLTSQGVSYNYERKYFRSDGYAQYSDVEAYPDWVTYVHIVTSTMSYETINAYSTQVDSIPYMAGLNLFSDMVSLTNLGIDL